jgi:hypothetical protein
LSLNPNNHHHLEPPPPLLSITAGDRYRVAFKRVR